MSAIEQVSVTQGCPLGGVPLYILDPRNKIRNNSIKMDVPYLLYYTPPLFAS